MNASEIWHYATDEDKKIHGIFLYKGHPRNRHPTISGNAQGWDHTPLVPLMAVAMLALIVSLLVWFRQNPPLIAAIVFAVLIVTGMILTLSKAQDNMLTYE